MKLGDISPLAGIMTGEGAIGKLARKGVLGLAPRMIAQDTFRESEEARRQEEAAKGMKRGGVVSSASKRADGCAVRGKTRGKIV